MSAAIPLERRHKHPLKLAADPAYTLLQLAALDAIAKQASVKEIDRLLLDVKTEHQLRRDLRHVVRIASQLATRPISADQLHVQAYLARYVRKTLEHIE